VVESGRISSRLLVRARASVGSLSHTGLRGTRDRVPRCVRQPATRRRVLPCVHSAVVIWPAAVPSDFLKRQQPRLAQDRVLRPCAPDRLADANRQCGEDAPALLVWRSRARQRSRESTGNSTAWRSRARFGDGSAMCAWWRARRATPPLSAWSCFREWRTHARTRTGRAFTGMMCCLQAAADRCLGLGAGSSSGVHPAASDHDAAVSSRPAQRARLAYLAYRDALLPWSTSRMWRRFVACNTL
jgi:hypothetical protein